MLNHSASLLMSTGVLKALPGKLDIKRHLPSVLYLLQPRNLKIIFPSEIAAQNLNRGSSMSAHGEKRSLF